MTTTPTAARRGRPGRRRALAGVPAASPDALALRFGLLTIAGLYAALTAGRRHAQAQAADAALSPAGQQLYNRRLHHLPRLEPAGRAGPRAEPDRRRPGGGLLPGVQRAGCRWPARRRRPCASRRCRSSTRTPRRAQANLDALGAYIQANGGGPTRPEAPATRCAATTRRAAASCSGSTARRATTSPGGAARCRRASTPRTLDPATETQIYTAMLTGPQNMPKFSDRQLTPEEKKDIIAYIKSVDGRRQQPRRQPAGGIGPASEGVVAFIVGLGGHDRIATLAGGEGMSTTRSDGTGPDGTATAHRRTDRDAAPAAGHRGRLEDMSQEELARLAASSTTSRSSTTRPSGRSPAPAPRGAPSDRVALWFLISALCGAGVPGWRSCSGRSSTCAPGEPGYLVYALYTPLIGGTASASACSRWASR